MSESIVLQNEEENVIIATFNITTENTEITLQNLTGMTEINWGDGTINSELSHIYSQVGEYICKIYNVTSIGQSAFLNCSSLTEIVIGNSITSIGSNAFSHCESLTSIEIPDSITSIGSNAFDVCSSLTEVVIPDSVKLIGDNAFAHCRSLTSVVIPESVTSIGMNVFQNCSSLTEVVIPDSVMSIGMNAFAHCRSLTSVVIPNSVMSIKEGAFQYCSSLTSVVIPDSVAIIKDSAFQDCSSLTEVVIGDSVSSIGHEAFYNCSSLTEVVIGDLVTTIGNRAFSGCSSLVSVIFKSKKAISAAAITNSNINNTTPTYYVPAESVETYRSAWTGVVAAEQIQPDLTGERLVTLDGLKTYHNTLKEKYLDSMATQDWVNEKLVGKTDYLGTVAAMADLSTIAGAGDYHRVSTEFTYDESTGEVAHVGDILIAVIDLANLTNTQTKEYWDLVHTELGAAPATSEEINSIFEEASL